MKDQFSSSIFNKTSENISSDFFIYLMSSEIAQLKIVAEKEKKPSVSRILFTSGTNIWPEDVRTFLGRELPGFYSFNTEIAVAGTGTNLTSLPIESAPPIEVLLKEREVAEQELASKTSPKKEELTLPNKNVAYIYHSHSWEAFLPLLNGGTNLNEAASFNENANVIGIGKKLKAELIERGIGTSQSTANVTEELKEKNWNYNNSYQLSRELVQEAISTEQSLTYLFDIHRDSQPKKITTIIIDGKSYARLFFIVGKENKNFEENLHFAKELNQKLEEKYPGISRGVFIKGKDEGNGVYNQDLTNKSMLLEFGGVENNMEELNLSVEAFADVFSEYYWKYEEVSEGIHQ